MALSGARSVDGSQKIELHLAPCSDRGALSEFAPGVGADARGEDGHGQDRTPGVCGVALWAEERG